MKLETYKSLWGMPGAIEASIERISLAGYDGVEAAPQEMRDVMNFRSLLDKHHLKFVALVYTEGSDHTAHFEEVVKLAADLQPVKIVAHGGRDTMPYVKQVRFFERALTIESRIGIPIAHETHRRRPLFSPMNTIAILRELAELNVNIDFSHWCCVTESLLEDHEVAIRIAAQHAVHLHGRVGYENGPQVPDPRVQEWNRCLVKHEQWWDIVIDAHRSHNAEVFTFTPEYGPPTYMHTLPRDASPAADLWEVCLWAKERFTNQFKSRATG